MHYVNVVNVSGASFWSCFSGSDVRGILKLGSEFSVDKLCLGKTSITLLKTYDSLDIRRIKS